MEFPLFGAADAVRPGVRNLMSVYPYPASFDGSITVKWLDEASPSLTLRPCSGGMEIGCRRVCDFFRALGCLFNGETSVSETAVYEKSGVMIDLSRDAVYTVAQMKQFLGWIALCGLNTCYLYMEDTYRLEKYPYFGYLRGAYSMQELKELDDFADSLGIELIPCIQTLSHLTTTLQWDYAVPLRDTMNTLMVDSEPAYELIREMLTQLKQVFRTRRIHIGMDEAMDLGTGARLRKEGYEPPFDLMLRHLNRVNGIAQELGLTPIIWDDMFYRAKSEDQLYYDPRITMTPEDIARVPKNVQLAYWDYYHDEQGEYECFLEKRRDFDHVIFAGGIWKWNGWVPNYGKTFVSTHAALKACRNQKVDEILATMWGDDGDETPLAAVWPGLVLFGQYAYDADASDAAVSRRCKAFTGLSLEDFLAIEELDLLPGCARPNTGLQNPSKYLLYQDLLLGAFDSYTADEGIAVHYRKTADRLHKLAADRTVPTDYSRMLSMYAALGDVLELKSRIGYQLRTAYRNKDRIALTALLPVLSELSHRVELLQDTFAAVWCAGCKGTGLEVHDIRLGGILGRIRTVKLRLRLYLDGQLTALDELEEELLPYDLQKLGDGPFPVCNRYQLIATQNVL